MTTERIVQSIRTLLPGVQRDINAFASETLRCKGGRVGSGLGTLLESLWNFYTNRAMREHPYLSTVAEIAWIADNEYNDYACIHKGITWYPNAETRAGEHFRIETKSMCLGDVDESKGHFDQIQEKIRDYDQLLVLLWKWETTEDSWRYPRVVDQFFGTAKTLCILRDQLHLARGGAFIDRNTCPDQAIGCISDVCRHHGEPLNARGVRERRTGPQSCKGEGKSNYAANFGGLIRMLKTDNAQARAVFRQLRQTCDVHHDYISFVHRHFPDEEYNQYPRDVWLELANRSGLPTKGASKPDLVARIRQQVPNYRDMLRLI